MYITQKIPLLIHRDRKRFPIFIKTLQAMPEQRSIINIKISGSKDFTKRKKDLFIEI